MDVVFFWCFNFKDLKSDTKLPIPAPIHNPMEQVIGQICHGLSQSSGIGNAPNHAPISAPIALQYKNSAIGSEWDKKYWAFVKVSSEVDCSIGLLRKTCVFHHLLFQPLHKPEQLAKLYELLLTNQMQL